MTVYNLIEITKLTRMQKAHNILLN